MLLHLNSAWEHYGDITWKFKILIMQIDVDSVDSRHIIIELCHINDAQRFYQFTKRQDKTTEVWTERKRKSIFSGHIQTECLPFDQEMYIYKILSIFARWLY